MGRTCCVPGCKSGYRSEIKKNPAKRSFFHFPNEEKIKNAWLHNIPRDKNEYNFVNALVCDLHFDNRFLITTFETLINKDTNVSIPRNTPSLSPDAVPTVFPNLASYLTKKLPKQRTSPSKRKKTKMDQVAPSQKKIKTGDKANDVTIIADENTENVNLDTEEQEIETSEKNFTQPSEIEALKKNYENTIFNLKARTIKLQEANSRKNFAITKYKRKNIQMDKENKELKQKLKLLEAKDKVLKMLPEEQQMVIDHYIQHVKKSKNGIRYSKKWLICCLLLRIRNPSCYTYLKRHKFLPLPARSTIQSYISGVKAEFGFDDGMYELLKVKLENMSEFERRGIIAFDEIKLRSHVELDKGNQKMIGIVDTGPIEDKRKRGMVGDHALVFLFKSFGGGWLQTLGCFCTKGAASAEVLIALLMETISRVETAGAITQAIVCDGATTNSSAFKKLQISGELNSVNSFIYHPIDSTRKIHFLRDFPHLIKCVRNQLWNVGKFYLPNNQVAAFSHYESIYKEDIQLGNGLRSVPWLCDKHIYPNSFLRMNVDAAFKMFSNKIITGFKIHKNFGVPELQDCDGTILLAKKLNKLIDCMNAKTPTEGLRKNGWQYSFLHEFIEFLDNWERYIKTLHPGEQKYFLSKSTLEGLRLSIYSMINLINELHENNFKYVLTAGMSQDSLEIKLI